MTRLRHTSSDSSLSMGTYGKKKKLIYLHLIETTNKYTPTNVNDIANDLGFNKSTIRHYLNILSKENKILKKRLGMITTYWTYKTNIQLIQHIQPKKDSLFPMLHGLNLYIDRLTSSDLRLGVKCKCSNRVFSLIFVQRDKSKKSGYCVCNRCGAKIRNNFPYRRVWRERNITFVYGKHRKSCQIWIGSSMSPLDYYDFKDLLNYLEGLVGIPVWDNLNLWDVKQVGFNNDIRARQLDRIDFDCTLNDLGHVFARMYEKDFAVDTEIEKGVRFEVHQETIQKLSNFFMPLIQGSMDMSAVLNINAALHLKIGELIDELKVNNKRQRRIEDAMKDIKKQMKKLKKK